MAAREALAAQIDHKMLMAAREALAAQIDQKMLWPRERRWLLDLNTMIWPRERRWPLNLITKRYWPRKNRRSYHSLTASVSLPVVSCANSFRSAAGRIVR